MQHFHKKPCWSSGLFARHQHKRLLQGFDICWETGDGRKNSAGLGGTEAARHCESDFRWRRCVSDGGAKLSGDGRPAGRLLSSSHHSSLHQWRTWCCQGSTPTVATAPHTHTPTHTPAVRYSGEKLQMRKATYEFSCRC